LGRGRTGDKDRRIMTRRLLNLLTALSLLLCVAVAALWVTSYTADVGARRLRLHVTAREGVDLHTVELRDGAVEYVFWRRSARPPSSGAYVRAWHVDVPLGVPGAVLLAVLLLLLSRHRKRQLLRRAGVCRSCGYDLRASPGRCPECGTATSHAEG
jgi:hypothetical protein